MGTSLDIKIKRANKVYHAGDLNLPPDQEAGTGMQTGHQHLQTGVQEVLSGVVVISGKDSIQHQGVSLTVEGSVNLQLSAKSVGVFEAFYNSVKPIQIISSTIEMVKPGKFPSGKTEIPFEFPLHVKGNKVLYETYHGVFVNIQRSSPAPPLGALLSLTVLTPLTCGSLFHLDRSLAVGQDHDKYTLRCDMRRSLLAKDLTKTCEFIVHSAQRASNFVMENEPKFSSLPRAGPEARTPLGPQPRTHSAVTTAEPPPGQLRPQKGKLTPSPVDFTITPETLQNVKEFIFCAAGVPPRVILSEQRALLPKFLIRGHLNSTNCVITQPLTGELVVESSEAAIKSIELQLVRVETCGCAEGYARDATEIQNIQIADGDVCRSLSVPIYMVFPRLFTCPTLETTNFKVVCVRPRLSSSRNPSRV
ncbi:vacuolar protein sorting-associated protein 26C isoform X3 [Ailuropoda melanoleuca]|uniref:vacuolar protein sorting-associated protein 26C isoform X3 n=1 Tax=Ailuropoda melanoleuca TaxID=9646 RepID=UPI001494498A|nr:vacuolar protein sorting-associated protein 26C isoform X3 [Ailuropoda melanoleuca]